MANQTDRLRTAARRGKLLLLFGLLSASCSRPTPPNAAYERVRSIYFSGDINQTATLASANAARWSANPKSPWFWRFRLLQAEALTAQGRKEEASSLLADAVPGGEEFSQLEVQRLIDQAALQTDNKTELKAELLRRARATVSDPELAIRIKISDGLSHVDDGKQADLREALKMAERMQSLYWQSSVLVNLSYSSKVLQRYEESVEFGLRALSAAEKIGARRLAAKAHGNLGSPYLYLGETELAVDHEEKSAKTLEALGDRTGFMIALGELGLSYDRQGDTERAIASYQQAFQIACDLKKEPAAERFAGNLALTLSRTRQWDAAADWNQRALELAPQVKDNLSIPYLTRNRAYIAYGRGQPEEAMRICEELLRTKTKDLSFPLYVYDLMGTIDAEAKRFQKSNREFESGRKIVDSRRSDLTSSGNRISLLSRLIPFYQDYVDSLVQQNNDAAALRIAESSRARVLAERLELNLKAEQFPDAASLQRVARATDASLLSFWLAPVHSFAWLITANSVRRFALPAAGEIEKLVTAYRDVVEHSLRDPIETNDPSGPKLWNALMAGIAQEIPRNSRVIVIPDGALHRLNLETLVAPSPSPHYWIEDAEVSVAPSITIAASKPGPAAGRSLLLIGAPEYTGTQFQPLKNAGTEVHDIQTRLAGVPQTVHTGPQASPAVYRAANPAQFSLIHFAAHAEANREYPLDSAVILSREPRNGQNRLYARDVIDVPIHADLVTISACRSAGVRSYAGEGLIGFAWAFLQAGARQVVAGLWDVSDTSTEPLMNRFYGGVAAGQNPVTAMRSAKLALAREDARYAKPFYWGPFQVYVGSGARAGEGK